MTIQQLDNFFTEYGYNKIPSNLPDYSCYFRIENEYVTVCNTMKADDRFYLSSDEYRGLRIKIRELFTAKGFTEIHFLTLVIAESWQNVQRLCLDDPFCWMISASTDRLVVAETQAPDFYGLRGKLDELLTLIRDGKYISPVREPVSTSQSSVSYSIKTWLRSMNREKMKALPWISILLVAANIVIYIMCCIFGQAIYDAGSLSVRNIENDGSFYRIITSMFLHADINHLTSNMLILFYIGEEVEKKVGHVRFTILYFISGIVGSIFSMGLELFTYSYFSTVGASGAVFGIIGALLFLVLVSGGRIDEVTTGRIVFIIAFSLYTGFTAQGVNNAAHVGGLLGGIAAMAVIWAFSSRLRNRMSRRDPKGAGHED